jgi:aspartate dehydrogenase
LPPVYNIRNLHEDLSEQRRTMPIAISHVSSATSERRQATQTKTKVAIAGMGAIGRVLVRQLSRGVIPDLEISGVAVRDKAKAVASLAAMGVDIPIVELAQLAELADIVVECVPAALLEQVVTPVLRASKKVIVLSVGALLDHPDLIELARATGGRIIVPSGALLGLDAVCAAAEGKIHSVAMITRKPAAGLIGAPYLLENAIDITDTKEPVCVFKGTAREAAKGFPANLNVAAALSLAGIGPDLTTLEVWADPTVTRNIHRIVVDSDSAHIDMSIENIPSENPKTGRITALSVIATLRKLNAALRVGC